MIRRLAGATMLVLLASSIGPLAAQDLYYGERDNILPVSEVLPPELRAGPHFVVVDPVVNAVGIDVFRVISDYGEFLAEGRLMLRIRLREIQAIAVIEEESGLEVAGDAFVRQGKKTWEDVVTVAKNPGKAVTGFVPGVVNRFKEIGRDIVEDVGTVTDSTGVGDKAGTLANRWLGVDAGRRRWAQELRVDPYSTNEVLQDQLTRVSRVEGVISEGSKRVLPVIPYTGFIRDVYGIVWNYDYRELMELNRKRLIEIGATPEQIERYLAIEAFTPSIDAALIAAVLDMDNVANRIVVIGQAMPTETEPEALFFFESVVMASWFHTTHTPLLSMISGTGLPAALTSDDRLVVFAAADFPQQTEFLSGVAREMTDAYAHIPADREIVLAGGASPEWTAEMEELGWAVRTWTRNEYLPRIQWGLLQHEDQVLEDPQPEGEGGAR